MNLSQIAENLPSDLRDVDAETIKSWAEGAGKQLAQAKVTRGYFLTIVERIGRVLGECRAQVAQHSPLNYDDLIFLEPHIAYQAGRKSGREQQALSGLKGILATALAGISQTDKSDDNRLRDLMRLNQLFQAMAAYYVVYGGGQDDGNGR